MLVLEHGRRYLVVNNTIILRSTANNWLVLKATDEERQLLTDAGYQMIGLREDVS